MRMEVMEDLKENQTMLKIEVREGIYRSHLNEKTLEKNLSTQQRLLNTRSNTSINLI
jgi:hypothetical protein